MASPLLGGPTGGCYFAASVRYPSARQQAHLLVDSLKSTRASRDALPARFPTCLGSIYTYHLSPQGRLLLVQQGYHWVDVPWHFCSIQLPSAMRTMSPARVPSSGCSCSGSPWPPCPQIPPVALWLLPFAGALPKAFTLKAYTRITYRHRAGCCWFSRGTTGSMYLGTFALSNCHQPCEP
jgi:hypothetical protein